MNKRAMIAALGLTLGLLAAPGAANAEDPEYPVYDITSFPAHGATIEQRDCADNPTTQGPAPYGFVWDPVYRQDVLELSAHSGTTSVGIDVADTSMFEFWEFGNDDAGTAEVVVDLGDDGLLHGTGELSYYDGRGGTWFIGKDTMLDWTQVSDTFPDGRHLGTASMAGLPAGYTGPARVSLRLSDCPGSATGTRMRIGSWWLDAGAGAQWFGNFGTPHKLGITSSVSRTSVTRPGRISLSATVSNLPAGEQARLQLWRKARYLNDNTVFAKPTWLRVRTMPVSETGRATVSVTPTENTKYMWYVVPAGNGIETRHTAPIAVTVTPRMTLRLHHRTVHHDHKITVSGRVDGHERGVITLYRKVGARLVKIKTAPAPVFDHYSITFRPHKAGTWRLIAKKTATRELTDGTSNPVTLRVR